MLIIWKYEETIEHLASEYIILVKNENVMGHDKYSTHLLYSIRKKLGTERAQSWYSHIPKSVCECENVAVKWNQGIQRDRFWPRGQI
jgi:hypothetical protein